MQQNPEEYLTPHEAADRLYALNNQLGQHNVPLADVEAIRLISEIFARHLNSLATFSDRLHDLAEGFL